MGNAFVHAELQTPDLARAKDFYGKLFDWKLIDVPMPGTDLVYTLIDVDEGTGGGMFSPPEGAANPQWQAYVAVDDIEAYTAKARELGATVLQAPTRIGEYGWLSVIRDPTGATIAMWQMRPGLTST
jgi:hypothetical protein